MKKIFILFLTFSISIACNTGEKPKNTTDVKKIIGRVLNQWHKDVAQFDYDAYFNKMTEDAVFVGTDASEVWSKEEFQDFCKPFFDKKQTWDFKPISRNVYLDHEIQTAWFDELLDTWMGVCRGSGVLIYEDTQWKIQHYVLSVVVPNEDMNKVVAVKKERDSLFLKAVNDF